MQQVTSFRIVGSSQPMAELRKRIEKVAPTTSSVMLLGERGTGKELVARALHLDRRGRFVAVNCGAIVDGLFESELFGHVKGAFTGAMVNRVGRIEQARDGTLFLDEIRDMPIGMQVKLLRALEGYGFERVGSNDLVMVNTRVVCATSGNLPEAIAQQRFRADLYDRLNIVTIRVPALRERLEDVPELVDYFLLEFNSQNPNRGIGLVSPGAMDKIREIAKTLDGNIRGLKALVERLANFAVDGNIVEGNEGFEQKIAIPAEEPRPGNLRARLREFEKREIENALRVTNGVIVQAAELLGIDRKTVDRKIERYGINVDDLRRER